VEPVLAVKVMTVEIVGSAVILPNLVGLEERRGVVKRENVSTQTSVRSEPTMSLQGLCNNTYTLYSRMPYQSYRTLQIVLEELWIHSVSFYTCTSRMCIHGQYIPYTQL